MRFIISRLRAPAWVVPLVLAAAAARAQRPAMPGAVQGTVSVGFADPIGGHGRPIPVVMVYDEATRHTYQVDVDSTLAQPYGGIAALNGRRVQFELDGGRRVSRVVEVAPRTAAPVFAQSSADVAAAMLGSKKILELGCQFTGASDTPWPGAELQAVVMTNAVNSQAYWTETSNSQMNFAGSLFPNQWKTVPGRDTTYFPTPFVFKIDSLIPDCVRAYANSVAVQNYDILIVHTSGAVLCCEVGGRMTLAVNGVTKQFGYILLVPSTTVGTPASNTGSITHELGHALGLLHSSPEDLDTYQSDWDVMSNADDPGIGAGTIAGHKDQLGWIPAARRFVAYTGTSTITLDRSQDPPSDNNYLIGIVPIGVTGTYYTVELRQKVGYDSSIPGEGVLINKYDESNASTFLTLDGDGNGNVNDAGAIWTPGETFFDHANQIAITVNAITGTSANVTIRSGGGTTFGVTRLGRSSTVVAGSAPVLDSLDVNVAGVDSASVTWTAARELTFNSQGYAGDRNSWLTILTPAGTGAGEVRFQRNVSGLAPGTYVDSFTVRSPDFAKTYKHYDTLTVTAPATLYLGLSVTSRLDSTNATVISDSAYVSITGPGASTAQWTVRNTGPTKPLGRNTQITESGGTGSGMIHWQKWVPFNAAPGFYLDTIVVALTANPATQVRFVDSLRMDPPTQYTLTARSHRDSIPVGGASHVDSVGVSFAGTWATNATWYAEAPAPDSTAHFIVPQDNGFSTNDAQPRYRGHGNGVAYYRRVATGYAAGTYIDTLTIRGPYPNAVSVLPQHQPAQLVIDTLVVYAVPKAIAMSPASRRDTVALGLGRSIDSTQVLLLGAGGSTTDWTAASTRAAGFFVVPSSGFTGQGTGSGWLVWSRNLTAIAAPGVYVDTITVTSKDGTLHGSLLDSLVVLPGTIALLSSTKRDASAAPGTSATLADSVNVSFLGAGAATAAWTATKTRSYTTLTSASGTGAGVVRWTRNTSGLAAGTYVDTITLSAGAAVRSAVLYDTLRIQAGGSAASVALAHFDTDSVGGVIGMPINATLSVDLSGVGQSLGTYTVNLTWDPSVAVFDSVGGTAGFPSPNVSHTSNTATITGTNPTGVSGDAALATLHFHFGADSPDKVTTLTPSFTVLRSPSAVDLSAGLSASSIKFETVPGALRGDVNLDGKLTSADALLALQYLVGQTLTGSYRVSPNADANCNGKIEAVDAQIILAALVGLPPAANYCVGTIK